MPNHNIYNTAASSNYVMLTTEIMTGPKKDQVMHSTTGLLYYYYNYYFINIVL